MFKDYFKRLKDLMEAVEKDEEDNIKKAANVVADCIQRDGLVHVFGCGHSHMIAEELFYRAGGLVPINPILIEELMLHRGAVRSSVLEKTNDFAETFIATSKIKPGDVVIVVSTSGRNPVPIDVAEFSKKQGATVIAITSPSYAKSQPSRHKSGKHLYHSVDISIDNHIEIGDALMQETSSSISYGSGSTIISMAIANGIVVEAVKIMLGNNFSPPIFKSGNIDGSEEYNKILIKKYKDRIPMLESE